jgi:hypothetical protein
MGLKPASGRLLHHRSDRIPPRWHDLFLLRPAEQVAQGVEMVPDSSRTQRAAAMALHLAKMGRPCTDIGDADALQLAIGAQKVNRTP